MAKTKEEFLLELITNYVNQLAVALAAQSELIEWNGRLQLEKNRLEVELNAISNRPDPDSTSDSARFIAEEKWQREFKERANKVG